jgi:HlyD family secretion protein
VDVGANASGSTTSGSSASNASSSSANTVIAYTAVLSVANPEMLLRPGMTATAEIVTAERRNVILVPNAALRWSPERDAASTKGQGGVTSVLVPRGGRGGRRGGAAGGREVSIGRGSRQTVYVLGADGQPQAVQITVGESNGSVTEVLTGDLREGQEVITSRLAPGQVQDKSDQKGDAGNGRGRNRGGGGGNQVQPANQAAPAGNQAQAAGSETNELQALGETPPPPPVSASPRAVPPAGQGQGGAASSGPPGGRNVRDMTPEQRRAYFQSLTPEQRAAMRERRRQRQQQGGGDGGAPDGQ